jgi:hypothetical protein
VWAFAVAFVLLPLAVAGSGILAQRASRAARVGAMSLTVVALAALAAIPAGFGRGREGELGAASVAMVLGAFGGVFVALLADWTPHGRSDAQQTRTVFGTIALMLALMVAFGLVSCWFGLGAAALVRG